MIELGEIVLRGPPDVVLRPLTGADSPSLVDAATELRDSYGFIPVPNGVEEVERYIDRALAQRSSGKRYPFAIEWRGRVVGTTSYFDFQPWEWPAGCELQREAFPDAVEIGYTWLAASAQRTSCNTQSKFLLLDHAFEKWRVHSVCLRTDERNVRSRRAIERLGCRLEGVRRAHMPGADSTVRSSAFYSIIANEWPAVRDRLIHLMSAYKEVLS